MTDRYKALVVTLDAPIRSDDAELVMNAIRAMRCVCDVSPIVDDASSHADRMMVRMVVLDKVHKAIIEATE